MVAKLLLNWWKLVSKHFVKMDLKSELGGKGEGKRENPRNCIYFPLYHSPFQEISYLIQESLKLIVHQRFAINRIFTAFQQYASLLTLLRHQALNKRADGNSENIEWSRQEISKQEVYPIFSLLRKLITRFNLLPDFPDDLQKEFI